MKQNQRGKRWTAEEDLMLADLNRKGVSLRKASSVLKRTQRAVKLRGYTKGLVFCRRALPMRSRKDSQPDLPLLFKHERSKALPVKVTVNAQRVGDAECTTVTATEHVRKKRRTTIPGQLLEVKPQNELMGNVAIVLVGALSLIVVMLWAVGETEVVRQFTTAWLLLVALLAIYIYESKK